MFADFSHLSFVNWLLAILAVIGGLLCLFQAINQLNISKRTLYKAIRVRRSIVGGL
jgi:hypothetical protein